MKKIKETRAGAEKLLAQHETNEHGSLNYMNSAARGIKANQQSELQCAGLHSAGTGMNGDDATTQRLLNFRKRDPWPTPHELLDTERMRSQAAHQRVCGGTGTMHA